MNGEPFARELVNGHTKIASIVASVHNCQYVGLELELTREIGPANWPSCSRPVDRDATQAIGQRRRVAHNFGHSSETTVAEHRPTQSGLSRRAQHHGCTVVRSEER